MPHFAIEYSANLDDTIDMAAFCDHIRRAACNIETFPMAGIRVRAFRAEAFSIADGNPDHAFIDISIRLRAGRAPEVKAEATQQIFAAAQEFLSPVLQSRSLALSLEMRDIDPNLSPKTGTIRRYL